RHQDEHRHRHPVRVHASGRRAHVLQLRRRAQGRWRGREQEDLRPARLGCRRRNRHGRPCRRGRPAPGLGRKDAEVAMSDELGRNLLGIPATLLTADEEVDARLAAGEEPVDVVAQFPASSLAWSLLADEAYDDGRTVESYAYARVGYHRGLDALRHAGWRGQGPVPYSHEPNRGFLRSLYALQRAAAAIGEASEVDRIGKFLTDSDPTAAEQIAAAE